MNDPHKPVTKRELEGCIMALIFFGIVLGVSVAGVVKFLAWWRIAFGS